MTRTTNARIAGFTFLFYIAIGIASIILFGRATSGDGIAAKLAGVAQHASNARIDILLSLLACFAALVLAVTLYAITRDEDPDLAMLVLCCRVGEGVLGGISLIASVGLLWLATAAGADAPDAATANALGAFLFQVPTWNFAIAGTFFAVGSTLFSYLLLRGRMVPLALAWLGVLASVLVVVLLPAQLAGFLKGPVTSYMWMPMLVFEVAVALWLLIKGVAIPTTR